MTALRMPRLEPVPIPTRDVPYPVALWRWLTWTRRWTVTEDYVYRFKKRDIDLFVPAGFEFDGASIPKPFGGLVLVLIGHLLIHFWCPYIGYAVFTTGLLWHLAGVLLAPTGILLIPGLFHDDYYEHDTFTIVTETKQINGVPFSLLDFYGNREGRLFGDTVFKELAIEVNGFRVINRLAWLALVLFGWVAWNGHRRKKVK